MTVAEICALPVKEIAATDAVLLLWSTWRHLESAFSVIRSWGFAYVSGFPWIKIVDPPMIDLFGDFRAKPTWGLGAWVRGCSEPILIAARGSARPSPVSWLGLLSKRLYHSRKPDSIYDYAESFPGPYLELFARRRRDDWDVWGNEVECSIQLPVVPSNQRTQPTERGG